MWLFENFEIHRHILHYSYLIVVINIQLILYHGRPLNKKLWKACESNYEAILDIIRVRVNLEGSLD